MFTNFNPKMTFSFNLTNGTVATALIFIHWLNKLIFTTARFLMEKFLFSCMRWLLFKVYLWSWMKYFNKYCTSLLDRPKKVLSVLFRFLKYDLMLESINFSSLCPYVCLRVDGCVGVGTFFLIIVFKLSTSV